jgi:hypothetical protein
MTPLAHFTLAEIPGTIALVLAGVAIGIIAAGTAMRPRALAVALAAVVAACLTIAVLADVPSVHMPLWLSRTADVLMLLAALALVALGLRGRPASDGRARERSTAPEPGRS